MTSAGGHWVRVRFSDASSRLDWIPEHQPPAPDGGPGAWHVVPDQAGGPSRWEWHPGSSPLVVAASSAEQTTPPPADRHETQPLPLQVVPNRPKRGAAPLSVHPQPKPAGSRPVLPQVRMRWAAWSLSVVLAVPVIYLLATNGNKNDASRTSAQSGLGSDLGTDENAMAAGPDSSEGDTYLRHLFELDSTQGYTFASLGEQYLLTTGTDSCGALDRGVSYAAVRESVMTQIPNGGQLVVASAATYLCPRNHAKLQVFTAGSQAATAQGAGESATGDTATG
jgi:hypothetical protein